MLQNSGQLSTRASGTSRHTLYPVIVTEMRITKQGQQAISVGVKAATSPEALRLAIDKFESRFPKGPKQLLGIYINGLLHPIDTTEDLAPGDSIVIATADPETIQRLQSTAPAPAVTPALAHQLKMAEGAI